MAHPKSRVENHECSTNEDGGNEGEKTAKDVDVDDETFRNRPSSYS